MTKRSLSRALAQCAPGARDPLESVLQGKELSFEQGLRLAKVEGADLEALVAVADYLRSETVGETITYVVNRNINFTNVCFVGCSFCGFGRGPQASDAYSLSFEEVVRRAREAWDRGATEVCIQGGLPRDLDGFFYRDLLRAIKRTLPAMHVHAFSPMEIDYGVLKTGLPLGAYLQMMKDEGLGSIPGTAAEILDDRIRQQLSPNKLPVARWVEIITMAHELGIPTSKSQPTGCAIFCCYARFRNVPPDLPSSFRLVSSIRTPASTNMAEHGRGQRATSTCAFMRFLVSFCTAQFAMFKSPG